MTIHQSGHERYVRYARESQEKSTKEQHSVTNSCILEDHQHHAMMKKALVKERLGSHACLPATVVASRSWLRSMRCDAIRAPLTKPSTRGRERRLDDRIVLSKGCRRSDQNQRTKICASLLLFFLLPFFSCCQRTFSCMIQSFARDPEM